MILFEKWSNVCLSLSSLVLRVARDLLRHIRAPWLWRYRWLDHLLDVILWWSPFSRNFLYMVLVLMPVSKAISSQPRQMIVPWWNPSRPGLMLVQWLRFLQDLNRQSIQIATRQQFRFWSNSVRRAAIVVGHVVDGQKPKYMMVHAAHPWTTNTPTEYYYSSRRQWSPYETMQEFPQGKDECSTYNITWKHDEM